MNHKALDVPEAKIEEYQQRLEEAGVEVTKVVNHDDSPTQASPTITDSTFVRSVYFRDPDGNLIELSNVLTVEEAD